MDIGQTVGQWARQVAKEIVPDALFLPGFPKPAPVEICVTSIPLDAAARQQIAETELTLKLVLAPELVLRRSIELPKVIGTQADAAIDLQLRQTLPGQGRGLIWRAVPMGRSGAMAVFGVFIVKQDQVNALLAELAGLGAKVEAVSLAVPGLQPVWQRRANRRQTARNWIGFTALSVVVAGLLAVIGFERARANLADMVSERSEQVAALEERLVEKRAEVDLAEETSSAALRDQSIFVSESRRLGLIADLTRVLPDRVWVSELSVSGDRLVLSGFTSGEVTEVIGLIQALPWAKKVELNGAVVFDSYSGQNRFELSLLIAGEDPT